ncbi:hypothetical protein, partial [Halalkalicoccus jeotgali]|uniref:hypothetical protein n=1 Tax=Halalkalicoccus jeotgali TaxID=413810 RepID=UPI001B7FAC4F
IGYTTTISVHFERTDGSGLSVSEFGFSLPDACFLAQKMNGEVSLWAEALDDSVTDSGTVFCIPFRQMMITKHLYVTAVSSILTGN